MVDHADIDHTGLTGVGGGIAATLLDAKGDLVVASAADTAARLAVGSNNQVLTADSAQATGVKWATPSSAGPTGYVLDARVTMPPPGGTTDTATPSADDAFVWPIVIPGPMLLQGLAIEVSATGSGTHEWGLFDFTSSITAATKIAGGSSAIGSTGSVIIAATGAPVTINPGGYAIILKFPNANRATVRRTSWVGGAAHGTMKFHSGAYTWDDTPDLSASWTADSVVIHVGLIGRLASGTQW